MAGGRPLWNYIGMIAAVNGTANSWTATVPTGVQQNDLLVACIAYRNAIAVTACTTNWTLVNNQISGNANTTPTNSITSASMHYCVRGASNPNLVFGFNTSGNANSWLGTILAFRGVNTASPYDTGTGFTQAATANLANCAGVTTAVNHELLIAMRGSDDCTVSGWAAATAPVAAQWQEILDANTTTGSDTGLGIAVATMPTAGATGVVSATSLANSRQAFILGAFKPGANCGRVVVG